MKRLEDLIGMQKLFYAPIYVYLWEIYPQSNAGARIRWMDGWMLPPAELTPTIRATHRL